MKSIICRPCSFVLLCLCFTSLVRAAPVEQWFERANSAYKDTTYDTAVVYYQKIIESGTNSSDVYYNLGNSYYRQNKIGLALLYYEKALQLSPNDPDIIANIRFANRNIADRIPTPERGFVETIFLRLHTMLSLGTQLWVLLSVLFVLSVLFSWGLFATVHVRLWLIYIGSLVFVFGALLGISAGLKIHDAESIREAIVIEKSIDARNQPEGETVLFTAHEGTKFRIRKQSGAWWLVSLPNGVSGWVDGSALGRI